MKKIGVLMILLVMAVVIAGCSNGSDSVSQITLSEEAKASIPQGAVHWHPNLKIVVDGKPTTIPPDLGYGTGKLIDTQLSGMRMSPIHTHESDGTLHLENNNPSSKPETLTLGYFFYVWDKTFNAECIFEYCTDKGTLKMSVNGEENFEFENYVMNDKDEIIIEFKSG